MECSSARRWNRAEIARGLQHLARSGSGRMVTRWHIEAGIAACHALAPQAAERTLLLQRLAACRV